MSFREFGDLAWVRDGAMRHMATLQPGDRAAVFTTSCETQLDFTDDRAKLRDTISKLQFKPVPLCGPGSLAQFEVPPVWRTILDRMSTLPVQRSVILVSTGMVWDPRIVQMLADYAIRSGVVIDTLNARGLNVTAPGASVGTRAAPLLRAISLL
jgi:hypothetical protein